MMMFSFLFGVHADLSTVNSLALQTPKFAIRMKNKNS